MTTLTIALLSCNNEDNSLAHVDKEVAQTFEQTKSYQIPIDKALLNLENFLEIIDGQSKGNGNRVKNIHRTVKNIETVSRKNSITTTSKGMNRVISPANAEAMMYLVNFDDNQGYAILAADERISSKIISIVDEGSISANDFQITNNEISLEEEGLENFSLYNAEENDYYVGLLAPTEQESITKEIMYEYAEREIIDYDYTSGDNSYTTSTVTDPWVIIKKISPMLTTLWRQDSPFNDNTPIKGFLVTPEHAPAGCVPIAVAQIMAYHEYPTSLTCNGVLCDWKKMKTVYSISNYNKSDVSAQIQVANFVSNIGAWCKTFYWVGLISKYGFALPKNAKDCMKLFGYSNAERYYGYYESKAKEMLDNGKPFFLAAISGAVNGHAWVVDGSIVREQKIRTVNNSTGQTISSSTKTEYLVHCNWGWGGKANGYYASGVFKPKNGTVMTEPGVDFNFGSSNSNFFGTDFI